MDTRKRQAVLRQMSHFHLAQLINGVAALRLVDLAQVYQNEQGELFANKHLHTVFDFLDAYYDACKKYDEACLEDAAFCQAYLEEYGSKPKKVGDDVERFVEVLEGGISSINDELNCSAGTGARKCCTRLLYLGDSQDVFNVHRYLFNQIALSYAKVYGLEEKDLGLGFNKLKNKIDEWRKTSATSHILDPSIERSKLKQACSGYLEHLKLSIMSEAGKSRQMSAGEREEAELGVKMKNHDTFSASGDARFARQLKHLRGAHQDNHVLTLAIEKYDELARLQAILTNESLSDRVALSKFKNRYQHAKPLLEKRRDTMASRFFKIIASIFTLGAGSFFIWRVHGRELTARVDKQLDGFEGKMFKR